MSTTILQKSSSIELSVTMKLFRPRWLSAAVTLRSPYQARCRSGGASIYEQVNGVDNFVVERQLDLRKFLQENRCFNIENFVSSVTSNSAFGPAAKKKVNAILDERYTAKVQTMTSVRHAKEERLKGMNSDYYVMIDRLVHLLKTLTCADRAIIGASGLPPFSVIDDCFALLHRTDPTDENALQLINYTADYFAELNRYTRTKSVSDLEAVKGNSSAVDDYEIPSMVATTESVLRQLKNFRDSEEVIRLIAEVGNYTIWLKLKDFGDGVVTANLCEKDLQSRMMASKFINLGDYSSEIDLFYSEQLSNFGAAIYGLQGLSSDSTELRQLVQLMYITNAAPQSSSDVVKMDTDADIQAMSPQDKREAAAAARTMLANVTNVISGLRGKQSIPVPASEYADSTFSLRPIWTNIVLPYYYFCLVPDVHRWKLIRKWYRQTEQENIVDVRSIYPEIEAITWNCDYPGRPRDRVKPHHLMKDVVQTNLGIELEYNGGMIRNLATSFVGLLDKCCVLEGQAFAEICSLSLRLCMFTLSKTLELTDKVAQKTKDAAYIKNQLKQCMSPLHSLCISVTLCIPRIGNMDEDCLAMCPEVLQLCKTVLFHLEKLEPIWLAEDQREGKKTIEKIKMLSSGGFEVRSLSEKRILNSLLRLVKNWRLEIISSDYFSKLIETGSLEASTLRLDQLQGLLKTMSVSTNEFLKGMSADIVLRGMCYVDCPTDNAPTTVVNPGKKMMQFIVDVEVDGDHHKLGNKRRFMELRDAHVTTPGQ